VNFAILVFPGTWSEKDCQYVLSHELGQRADLVWHRDSDIDAYDAACARAAASKMSSVAENSARS
jgi:phosphoribosylformylglycinamidine (FGAM) synthase-like amidotransferase family enzyme